MDTTRSTHLLRRLVGLTAVPALLLTAAACGGDDEDAGGSFCEDAKALEERFSEADETSGEDMAAALEAFSDLDPPEEIADEWDTMISLQEGSADIDPADPEAMEEIQNASDAVSAYMEDECGIEG